MYEKHRNNRTDISETWESRTYHVQLEQGSCKVPVVSQLVGSLWYNINKETRNIKETKYILENKIFNGIF